MRRVAQIVCPWKDPVDVLSAFADAPWTLGLLSGASGRWSYIAHAPTRTLTIGPRDPNDAFAALAGLLGEPGDRLVDGPDFQGGAAGLCAYELGDRVEPLGLERSEWPDLAAGLYDAILAFDHEQRQVRALGRGADRDQAQLRAGQAASWLATAASRPRSGALTACLRSHDGDAYEAAVAEVVDRIEAGEFFQANVARAWTSRLTPGARPFDICARLAQQSPAPYAAYLRLERMAVVSNSPERFLRVAEGVAETRPIKGTRPRGGDPASDAALAAELSASPKDRAENLMIVDLMRNDLSRVCAPGSVSAPALWTLETFANVHHLVSTVRGRLAAGRTAVDLLRACFPPGSVTGAPKVQAMKTIARLERPRGPYCGSIFWIGADGAMDSSVLIRTAACVEDGAGWRIEARAGAGIVADSDPIAERLETEAKASALIRALEGA
jgi:para-aminobenzoate synthetase component 1